MGIQFEKVNYEYKAIKKTYKALDNIDLNIDDKNEFIAICGQTGSGKSTLVQLMNALLLPTSGNLKVFNQELPPKKKNTKINYLRQKVGLVFQFPEYQLFESTILKDVMFGPRNFRSSVDEAMIKAKKALETVKIEEPLYEQSPFRISGGQMRRVAIAGILAMEPEVLVLDEPTRGLDPQGQEDIMEIFKEIHDKENKTVILITHDMDIVAQYAKRVLVLNHGKIVFDGTKEALFSHPNFNTFHLDYPTPIKILKHLEKTAKVPYEAKYTYNELLDYLKEVKINE
ncbi:ABC-type cobalt transport system, ATPase component [Alteracholeplasma palmae J233]|uniref:Energy-coupling factor transporter ATP-binding protein EcfA2 n=1 Tax=Alteracholeplasma palmae (strain ATCC 49389 / J233) TaxID=1318466 RepID=U4KLT4_ALTPJ|nr:energy-coupling factor transporter ATPase [Alteracholeplasma palmae]CCV64892.1 ABC-type cobalt transport system, ATPase component [Alteracholeplasma palmae J233]